MARQSMTSDSPSWFTFRRLLTSTGSLLPLLAALALLYGSVSRSQAADAPTPVHLRIAGQEVPCHPDAVSDSEETYVPLSVLSAVGAEGKLNDRGDIVTVTLSHSRQRDDLALAQIKGSPMIALSDLARLLNAVVLRPNVNGSKGDTVYLLARILSARFESDHIRITTSFPVPYHVRTLADTKPVRGYVDCVGASVSPDFKCGLLPDGETRIQKMRAGKYSDEVARVVVELPMVRC